MPSVAGSERTPGVRTCVRDLAGIGLLALPARSGHRQPFLIRTAAAELRHIDLRDALTITLLLAEREPHHFPRGGARWAARVTLETPGVDLHSAGELLSAPQLVAGGHATQGRHVLAMVLDDLNRSELADRIRRRRS